MAPEGAAPLPSSRLRTVHFFISGAIAGTVSRTVIAPYDRVRILLQLRRADTLWSAFRDIYLADGVAGYFRGNGINCVRAFWSKGLLFGLNDTFKQFLSQIASKWSLNPKSAAFSLLSGSLAGTTTQLMTYPLDVIRTRVSGCFGTSKYKGLIRTFLVMLHEEGPTSLYKGITPTLWGGVAYEGVKFLAYDKCREWCQRKQREGALPQWVNVAPVAGAMAGVIAIAVTHPNDTVRRRMQFAGSAESTVHFRNTLHAYRYIVTHEGVRSLYRGMASGLLRTVPGAAVQFGIYQGLKDGFAR